MRELKPEPAFDSWSVPGFPLTIEYSGDVMEAIGAAASQGLRQLSRGGLETGGILFGVRGAGSIRILSWQPMPCEHARGPALLLTPHDQMQLAKLLEPASREASLPRSEPLGWFVSHTRTGVTMTEPDLELFRQYFPQRWQTTLVLQPTRNGSAQAGFFVRESDGQVRIGPSYREFTIQPPTPSQLSKGGPRLPGNPRSPGPLAQREPDSTSQSAAAPRVAGRSVLTGRRLWIWLVPVLLALVVLGTMLERKSSPAQTASFALRANEVGGELRLEWDRNSELVQAAARANLDIKDGAATVPIALDAERLREGYFNYTRKSGDLQIRMTIYPVKGEPVQEMTRFVGPPAARRMGAGEAEQLRHNRDSSKAEIDQLRETLRKQVVRNRELEEAVRILEQRVEVEQFRSAKPR